MVIEVLPCDALDGWNHGTRCIFMDPQTTRKIYTPLS